MPVQFSRCFMKTFFMLKALYFADILGKVNPTLAASNAREPGTLDCSAGLAAAWQAKAAIPWE